MYTPSGPEDPSLVLDDGPVALRIGWLILTTDDTTEHLVGRGRGDPTVQ